MKGLKRERSYGGKSKEDELEKPERETGYRERERENVRRNKNGKQRE